MLGHKKNTFYSVTNLSIGRMHPLHINAEFDPGENLKLEKLSVKNILVTFSHTRLSSTAMSPLEFPIPIITTLFPM